jgi:hypothetical protein
VGWDLLHDGNRAIFPIGTDELILMMISLAIEPDAAVPFLRLSYKVL